MPKIFVESYWNSAGKGCNWLTLGIDDIRKPRFIELQFDILAENWLRVMIEKVHIADKFLGLVVDDEFHLTNGNYAYYLYFDCHG